MTCATRVDGRFDLSQLPTPRWQKLDAGRYIGTFHGVVTKNPDINWTNLGTHRPIIHDKRTITISVADTTKPMHPRVNEYFEEKSPHAYPDEITMKKTRTKWKEYGLL